VSCIDRYDAQWRQSSQRAGRFVRSQAETQNGREVVVTPGASAVCCCQNVPHPNVVTQVHVFLNTVTSGGGVCVCVCVAEDREPRGLLDAILSHFDTFLIHTSVHLKSIVILSSHFLGASIYSFSERFPIQIGNLLFHHLAKRCLLVEAHRIVRRRGSHIF
jgi:hypothetical protein